MKNKTIKKNIRNKINAYLETITDDVLKGKMKKDILITGGSIASMLLDEQVNDYDVYFKTRETTLHVAEYYCKLAKDNKIAIMHVLHKDIPFVQEVMKLDMTMITKFLNEAMKSNEVDENGGKITIDTPLKYFGTLNIPSSCQKYEDEMLSLRLLHNIQNTFENDIDRIKSYSFGSYGIQGKIDGDKIDSQKIDDDEENGKYEIKFISANAITLSDKIQLVTRFYGTPEEIHKNFDFVHAMGVYDYDKNELLSNTEQLESLLNKSLIYKGSLYPLASIFRTRKFIYRGWTIDAGQYLKMAFQLNELDLLDPYTLEEQLTGVDMLYFYQIISDLKYKQLTDDDFKPTTAYFISIIEKIFE